ncbi:MAG: MFS transporter [Acidobacteria bacterium]|nr:MFS transporter [Acidobacteriota bacterium]
MSATVRPSVKAADSAAAVEWTDKRWWVVCLLSFGMVIAYLDRVNLSAALTEIGKAYSLDKEQQGMAMSAFFWTYTAFQIPSGLLVDRFGVRWPYFFGFLLWSIASALTPWMTGLTALIAIRMLIGLGESVVTPSSIRYLSLHFSEKQRGLAVGLYMTGTKIGPAIGIPIAAYLVKNYGWQSMFPIIGLASLVWLIPWMTWVGKDDIAAQPSEKRAASQNQPSVSIGQILKSPAMWGVIIGTYCYMYFVYYCMTWMPSYFRERHNMSIDKMSWYAFVSFGGMAAVAAIAGWVADRMISKGGDPVKVRKGFTIAGFLVAATQTLSVFTDSVPLMIFFTVFSLCGLGLATANYWALTQTLVPGGRSALVAGIQNTAANLAGAVTAWLSGWLIQTTGSFDAPIKMVGFWLILGVGCYWLLVRREYAPKTA